MKTHLLSRGYNLGIINKARERISGISRQEALKRVEKETTKQGTRCFVTEYHPSLPSMGPLLRKHWSVMVERDTRLKEIFPKPSMVAYRRGSSLKELLVRAKMPMDVRRSRRQMDRQSFMNCGQQCVLCPFAKNATSHNVSGRTYQINGVLDCNTKGCVYKILCDRCENFVYYGETGRALRIRFGEHKLDIENARAKPVPEHLNLPGHTLANVIFIGIEKVVPTGDTFLRKQRESMYIGRGNAVHNGANRRF